MPTKRTKSRRLIVLSALCLTLVGMSVGTGGGVKASGVAINLSPFSTPFNSPVGIDYFEPQDKLIISANWPNGGVNNLELIGADGTHTPYSNLSFIRDELKIATVKSGPCTGGFAVGDVYSGNGHAGEIVRVYPDGNFANPWTVLPGEPATVRGSLFQDRYCSFGGDLIAVTGNEGPGGLDVGNVWRVNSSGQATLLAQLGTHLEGAITLPNNPAKYGPLAGRILAGAEDRKNNGQGDPQNGVDGRIFAIGADGSVITIGAGPGNTYQVPFPINPEDLDVIPQDGDFYGVNFSQQRILTAPAVDFAPYCGDVLVTLEFPYKDTTGLSVLRWSPSMNGGVGGFELIPFESNINPPVTHWEHVTFKGGHDCETCSGQIGDRVWKDLDSDGVQDGNEPGIANVTVTLTKQNDPNFVRVDTTDATGYYLFTDLCMGSYTVTVTPPAGDVPTPTGQGTTETDSNPNPAVVVLATNSSTDLTIDFGYKGPVIVGDTVWQDTNCNGIQDGGEPGIPGVLVKLHLGNINGPVLFTTSTDGSGHYGFPNFNPGMQVTVEVPFPQAALAGFTPKGTVSNSKASPYTFVTTGTGDDLAADFAFCPPPPDPGCTVTMGNLVWEDSNLNGIQDASELGVAGVTLELKSADGLTTIQTTTTNASGIYGFTAPCGTYTIVLTVPAGKALTTTNAPGSTVANDSNPNPSGVSLTVNAQSDLTVDFGLVSSLIVCPPEGVTAPGPYGTLTWSVDVNGDVYVRYEQSRLANDNSYGANAIGWDRGHTFGNLSGSDKAEFKFFAAGSSTPVLDFYMDYITTKSGTPSGYASLGPDGGDGSLISGLRSHILAFDSSLAKNLNTFCVAGNCTVAGTNLLVDSPAADADYNVTNPAFAGWNFTNYYEMKISHLAFGAAGFGSVGFGQIHNSPAKTGTNAVTPGVCGPVTPPGGGTGSTCSLAVSQVKTDKKEVRITIANSGSTDAVLTGLNLTWPAANGKLMEVKLEADKVYDNPDLAGPSATLTTANLIADAKKRSIKKGASDVLKLMFEKNVDPDLSHYLATATFGNCAVSLPTVSATTTCTLDATTATAGGKELKITLQNAGTVDAILTGLSVNWPAVNGKLKQVKLGPDMLYDKPDIAGVSATFTTADLGADVNKRKVKKGTSEVLTVVFEKNVDTDLTHYSGLVTTSEGCSITIP